MSDEATTPRGRVRRWRRTVWDGLADPLWTLNAILVSAPVVSLALLGWQRRWISDDGMISLRVVLNLSTGHGMVFNRGERVEASTTTLWVLLIWVLHELSRLPITTVAMLSGIVLGTLGLACATWGSVRLHARLIRPEGTRLWIPLGSLVVVALPPFWDYLTSALETGLTLGWLGVGWVMLVAVWRADSPHRLLETAAALWIGLGPLVRPDAAVFTVGMGVSLLLVVRLPWRGKAALVILGCLPGLAFQVFRMGYFAAVVPNTALAKSAASAQWEWGWTYFTDTGGRYWLWVPLLGIGLAAGYLVSRRGAPRLVVPILLAAAMHATYVVYVGGDFMHARFLLPSIFAVAMTVAAIPVTLSPGTRRVDRFRLVGLGIVGVWAVVVATTVRPVAMTEPTKIADERVGYTYLAGHPGWLGAAWQAADGELSLGRRLEERAAEGDSFFWATIDSGQSFYPSRTGEGITVRVVKIGHLAYGGPSLFIADGAALADPVGSRLVLPLPPVGQRRAGHNQLVPLSWHLARFSAPRPGESREVAAARAVLECGEVAELQRAVTEPMSAGRFWANLTSAARLSALSIPGDPVEAERELCHD